MQFPFPIFLVNGLFLAFKEGIHGTEITLAREKDSS